MITPHLIDKLIANDVNFALYHHPQTQHIELILQKTSSPIIIDSSFTLLNQQHGFVIAPFMLSPATPCVIIQPEIHVYGEKEINCFLHTFTQNLPLSNNNNDDFFSPPQQDYDQVFDIFHCALREKKADKLVLSHPLLLKKNNHFAAIDLFNRACEHYSTAFTYLCHTLISGTWLGSTPELLIEGFDQQWQTVALAGTQLTTHFQDWDDKNKQEQSVVTNYIQNLLDKLNISYSCSAPMTINAGHLLHLKTTINFSLAHCNYNGNKIGIGDIVQQLHPTPAVCGTPKKQAFDFILQHEGYDRRYYSGFIGYLSQHHPSFLYVNLRCMQIFHHYLILYAGGGLLPSSNKTDEWLEINAKLNIMRSILN